MYEHSVSTSYVQWYGGAVQVMEWKSILKISIILDNNFNGVNYVTYTTTNGLYISIKMGDDNR